MPATTMHPTANAVAKALTTKPKKLVAIGPATDKLFELREKKRLLMVEVEKVDAEYDELETSLFEKLDAEGTTKGAGTKATCSISESVVPAVNDWDLFHEFIRKKKYMHLLQRRTSDAAVRELFEKGIKVPGVDQFVKRRLNLRVSV